ncbi:MAG: hypothetical protein GX442_24660 [Candidatus Riflebacteria bacterium]|nr:hypothetical protein [Candidatus Riflebacteria bacterium]
MTTPEPAGSPATPPGWGPWLLLALPWGVLVVLVILVQAAAARSHNSTADFAVAAVCFGFGAVVMVVSNLVGVAWHFARALQHPTGRRHALVFLAIHAVVCLGMLALTWDGVIRPFLVNTVRNSWPFYLLGL